MQIAESDARSVGDIAILVVMTMHYKHLFIVIILLSWSCFSRSRQFKSRDTWRLTLFKSGLDSRNLRL